MNYGKGLTSLLSVLVPLVLTGLILSHGTVTVSADDKPMNVVFFLVDDLGWKDVGCFGSSFYDTPNIDKLAEQGVRFTNAYATCHVCSPTRASILTGKYPARLKLTDWLTGRREFGFQKLQNAEKIQALPSQEITIAEALKQHGYRTGMFGKWHLGEKPSNAIAHGFDVQIPHDWMKGWPRAGYYSPFKMGGIEDKEGGYLTDQLTDKALGFIEDSVEDPFFLYFALYSVHDPIHGRPDLVEKYRKKLEAMEKPDGPEFVLEGNPDDPQPLSRAELDELIKKDEYKGYSVLPRRTVKIKQHQDNIHFAAMVEAMDESLGRVMKKLDEQGIADNTMIFFFSDNGGMSGANFGNPNRIVSPDRLDRSFSTSNLPLRGAKGWLYEGGIRVPMIVKWPGKGDKGTVCNEPVISTDFFPSILEMTGLDLMPQQHQDGKSFVPALTGKPFERGPVFWHFPHYSNHGMQSPGGAIRKGKYKLLDYFEYGSYQLFDLDADPGESEDLAKSMPDIANSLHKELKAWRKNVKANMMPANPIFNP